MGKKNKSLKVFMIPVVWQMTGTMLVEAENLEDAEVKALREKPLPEEAFYLDDSVELDKEHSDYGENFEKDSLLSELERELIKAVNSYGQDHVDLIMSNNEGVYYGVYHSGNNSFGVTKDYPIECLSSKVAIALSNKLGIGFCED